MIELYPREDKRGFLVELIREDWKYKNSDFILDIKQSILSVSKPGVIRAWHCHMRGQNDYLTVLTGKVLAVYFDSLKCVFREFILEGILDHYSFKTIPEFRSEVEEREFWNTHDTTEYFYVGNEQMRLVKFPASMWHGTKNIGGCDACVIYFMDKLYDHSNPDEKRLDIDFPFNEAGVYPWRGDRS